MLAATVVMGGCSGAGDDRTDVTTASDTAGTEERPAFGLAAACGQFVNERAQGWDARTRAEFRLITNVARRLVEGGDRDVREVFGPVALANRRMARAGTPDADAIEAWEDAMTAARLACRDAGVFF